MGTRRLRVWPCLCSGMSAREVGVWRLRGLQHSGGHIEYARVRRQQGWPTSPRGVIGAFGALAPHFTIKTGYTSSRCSLVLAISPAQMRVVVQVVDGQQLP
jgi:hypothetical protein